MDEHIYIYVDQNFTSLGAVVSSATNRAIGQLNATGSKLKFYRTYSPGNANITITRNNSIGYNICGMAGFPSNGRVYPTVYLSETTLVSTGVTSESKLTFLIVHEMGHCLGLRHTDWWRGETSAIHIPGTPVDDPNSVMNRATCGREYKGLSEKDKKALRVLYPDPNEDPRRHYTSSYEIVYDDWGFPTGVYFTFTRAYDDERPHYFEINGKFVTGEGDGTEMTVDIYETITLPAGKTYLQIFKEYGFVASIQITSIQLVLR